MTPGALAYIEPLAGRSLTQLRVDVCALSRPGPQATPAWGPIFQIGPKVPSRPILGVCSLCGGALVLGLLSSTKVT